MKRRRGVPVPPNIRFIRSRRGFPLLAHKLVGPLAEFLAVLSAQMHGLGAEVDDPRWLEAARAVDRAAQLVREAARYRAPSGDD